MTYLYLLVAFVAGAAGAAGTVLLLRRHYQERPLKRFIQLFGEAPVPFLYCEGSCGMLVARYATSKDGKVLCANCLRESEGRIL